MKFGCMLAGVSPRHYGEVAQIIEAAGFESIWLPEHLIFPDDMPPQYPYSDNGLPPVTASTPLYDPWVALGFVACATTRLRLATNVFIAPLRHPVAIARSLATLDRLSGGRVTLGAGVGWLSTEFDIVGVPFQERGARMDEIVPLLRRLWSEPVIEHHGKFYDIGRVRFEPKPLQTKTGGLPIELGGASPPALRRAGRIGDGWIEIGAKNFDDLAAQLEVVNQARLEAGRENLPFEVTTGAWACKDAQTRASAAALGVTRVLAGPPMKFGAALMPDDVRTWAERFAADNFA
jgi:probable F420-dependent oxidoreductase